MLPDVLLHCSCYLPLMWLIALAFASTQFVDLPPTHTAYPAVQYLVEQKIISGYDNNTFLPNQPLTRAEALKISLLASGITPTQIAATIPFADIETGHWSVPFISYAIENQIVKGYEDNTFRPNQSVSRAEGIKILFSAFQITPPTTQEVIFSDVKSDEWFFPYANYLAKARLWPTTPPLLEPNKTFSRSEMAQLAYQLIQQRTAKSTPIIPIWAAVLGVLLWSITSYASLVWWRKLLPKKPREQLIFAILTGPISSMLYSVSTLIPQITIYEHAAGHEDSHLHPIKALLTPRKIGLEIYQYLVVKSLHIVKFCLLFLVNFLLAHILMISYYSYMYRHSFTF